MLSPRQFPLGLVGLSVLLVGSPLTAAPIDRDATPTTLYVYDLATGSTSAARTEPFRMAAPSWSPDGRSWLVNSGGSLGRVGTTGATPLEAVTIQNSGWIDVDHGIAPDGRTLAVTGSHHLALVEADGGAATRLVAAGGSYFHSWSPDGQTVYFSARRHNNLDLYAVSRGGGPERRLTTDPAADDTAAAAADGRWIYFASNRSGRMKIWRISTAGADAQAEQVTFDDRVDDAPHPSPDGKWLIYQSERPGPGSYLPDHETTIRKLALPGPGVKLDAKTSAAGTVEVARFVGRHKSLGASPWSPDGRRFVYAAFDPPPPRAFVVFFTPPGLAEPPGVDDRLTAVADTAERFLLDGMMRQDYPAAVTQLFKRTPEGKVKALRVQGTYPQGDPRYLNPEIRAEAIRLAQIQGQVAGEGHVWWIFEYLGPPPTRFATWQGSNYPEAEAYALVNYNSTPGAVGGDLANLTKGRNGESEFALKGVIHELGHALGLPHIGPDLSLKLGNALMGPNTSVYQQQRYPRSDQVYLTAAAAALLWKHPLLSGTTADRFHQPEDVRLTTFQPTYSRTDDRITIRGQINATPLPHSIIVQDDLGRPNDQYWHPAYAARVAPDGTFTLAINHPTRVAGHYRITAAFPNGMVTGGGPPTGDNRAWVTKSYRFRSGTFQFGN